MPKYINLIIPDIIKIIPTVKYKLMGAHRKWGFPAHIPNLKTGSVYTGIDFFFR